MRSFISSKWHILSGFDFRTIKLRAKFGVGNGLGLPLRCDEYQVFLKPIDAQNYLVLFCYQLDREFALETCCPQAGKRVFSVLGSVNVINGIINFSRGCANGRLRHKFHLGDFHGPTNPEFYFIAERSKLLIVTSTPAYNLYLHVYDVKDLQLEFLTTVTYLPDFYLEFVHLTENDDVLYFVPSESATLDRLEAVNIWSGESRRLTIEAPPDAVTEALKVCLLVFLFLLARVRRRRLLAVAALLGQVVSALVLIFRARRLHAAPIALHTRRQQGQMDGDSAAGAHQHGRSTRQARPCSTFSRRRRLRHAALASSRCRLRWPFASRSLQNALQVSETMRAARLFCAPLAPIASLTDNPIRY